MARMEAGGGLKMTGLPQEAAGAGQALAAGNR